MMVLEPLRLSWWHIGIDEFIFVFVLFGCIMHERVMKGSNQLFD